MQKEIAPSDFEVTEDNLNFPSWILYGQLALFINAFLTNSNVRSKQFIVGEKLLDDQQFYHKILLMTFGKRARKQKEFWKKSLYV